MVTIHGKSKLLRLKMICVFVFGLMTCGSKGKFPWSSYINALNVFETASMYKVLLSYRRYHVQRHNADPHFVFPSLTNCSHIDTSWRHDKFDCPFLLRDLLNVAVCNSAYTSVIRDKRLCLSMVIFSEKQAVQQKLVICRSVYCLLKIIYISKWLIDTEKCIGNNKKKETVVV